MESPTFYHTTVLLKEAVDALAVKPDGIYVDATFGGGGHSREILSRLGPQGKLIAFDHDADAWRNKPEDSRLIPVTENFRYLKRFLRLHGLLGKADGILADLGVSSWQFDTAERGFSIRFDGPLDMRMDARLEKTAATVLRDYSEAQLHKLFEQYGELRNARQLARQIVSRRQGANLDSIGALKAIIQPVMRGKPERYLAQVFQALRIEVNEELEALKEFLEQTVDGLRSEGRLSVITFHSLEDRLVKNFMKRGRWEDERNEFGQRTGEALLQPLTPKPIEPTEEETQRNPRARSARLRIAERTTASV
jgi:16S rRNA (cytosine1402-N4)-methyltransferase